jgi:hypothetical protein
MYSVSNTNKDKELDVIWQIAIKNDCHPTLIMQNKSENNNHTQHTPRTQNNTINTGKEDMKKWITFTFTGKETRYITKLFRNSNIKPAFWTTNTVRNQLLPQPQKSDKFSKEGVYKLKCKDCPLQYIDQTGRTFHTRFKENIRAV